MTRFVLTLVAAALCGSLAPAQDVEAMLERLRVPRVEIGWFFNVSRKHLEPLSERDLEPPDARAEDAQTKIEANEDTPHTWYRLASALGELGMHEDAQKAFQVAFHEYLTQLEGDRENAQLHLDYALALKEHGLRYRDGDALNAAASLFARAWELDESLGRAATELAFLYFRQASTHPDDEDAKKEVELWCDRALVAGGETPFAVYLLAASSFLDIATKLGELGDAELYGELAASTESLLARAGTPDSLLARSVIHLSFAAGWLGHLSALLEDGGGIPSPRAEVVTQYYDATAADLAAAMEGLDQYPELVDHLHVCRWFLELSRAGGASEREAELFETVLWVSVDPTRLAEIRLGIMVQANDEVAVRRSADTLVEYRDDARSRVFRGGSFYRIDQYADAAAEFAVAVERDQELAVAWAGLGVARLRAGADPAEAIAALEQARALDAEAPQIELALAVAWTKSGDLAKARAHVARALELDPESEDAAAIAKELAAPGG